MPVDARKAFGRQLGARAAALLVHLVGNSDAVEHVLVSLLYRGREQILRDVTDSCCTSRPGTESFIASRSRSWTAIVFLNGWGTQLSITRDSCPIPVGVVVERFARRRSRRVIQHLPHGRIRLGQRHSVRGCLLIEQDAALLGAFEHERTGQRPG